MSETSRGICKVAEYEKSIFYKAHCSCLSDRHDQTLILDIDNCDMIVLSIHSTISTYYDNTWCDTKWEKYCQWWSSQRLKWKQVFKLIFTGQIEADNEFMFCGEEQVQDYINALQSGINKIKNR